MITLSVIIPHFNDRARLYRCLDRLMDQVDAKVEVIVVDNGSEPGQRPELWRYPWINVIGQTQKGAGMARNLGVDMSSADRIAFLDSDCVPVTDWIRQVRQVPIDGRITGGKVVTFDEAAITPSGAQLFERLFAFDNKRYVTKLGFSVTANLVTSRSVFEAIGPFLPDVAEDYEWCRRATARGIDVVYEETMAVLHPTRSDWPALQAKWKRLMREAYAINRMRGGWRIRWGFRAALTAASVIRDAPKILTSPKIDCMGDRMRCLAVLCKLRLLRAVWMGQHILLGRA